MGSRDTVFKVCFFEQEKSEAIELRVATVEPSEFPGLVCFRDLILESDGPIIQPELAKAAQKFANTRSIHVPYHNILYIEEIDSGEAHPPVKLAAVESLTDERKPGTALSDNDPSDS